MFKISLIISFLIISYIAVAKTIPLDNKNIHVTGAAYIIRSPSKLFYKRFSDFILSKTFSDSILSLPAEERMFPIENARSTNGIKIRFKTTSSKIHLTFTQEPGLKEKGYFGIMRDGVFYKAIPFNATAINQTVDIIIDSLPANKECIYEVILPGFSNFSLTRLELDDSSKLSTYRPVKKKVFIGFGDSITHGRGQDGASYLTYFLSRKLKMELYNLGIGGSRIALPIAKMATDLPKAEVITILIGYNDFNGANKTVERFEKDYRQFLTALRTMQPQSKIFCISLLYTKKTENPKSHATPNDFRVSLEKLIADFQKDDKRLFFISEEKITSLKNLQPGEATDPVHLTIPGAKLFANELYQVMLKASNTIWVNRLELKMELMLCEASWFVMNGCWSFFVLANVPKCAVSVEVLNCPTISEMFAPRLLLTFCRFAMGGLFSTNVHSENLTFCNLRQLADCGARNPAYCKCAVSGSLFFFCGVLSVHISLSCFVSLFQFFYLV
jgi:lysophospholipase L1-like esterase